jgi:hypothetical protein
MKRSWIVMKLKPPTEVMNALSESSFHQLTPERNNTLITSSLHPTQTRSSE